MKQINVYTARNRVSIGRDFDRWRERGLEGLADGAAPGYPPRITQEEVRAFLWEKLSEQQERTCNATQLAEAVQERFGVKVTSETIRQHLLTMGFRWKRTRYVPSRPSDPEEERKARSELEELSSKS